eukprot:COSAG02_NODE_1994_length_10160_cov_84.117483_14_plen_36_part_00
MIRKTLQVVETFLRYSMVNILLSTVSSRAVVVNRL